MKRHELIAMKLKSDKPMNGTEIDDLVSKMGKPSMSSSFDDAKNSIKSMLNGLTGDSQAGQNADDQNKDDNSQNDNEDEEGNMDDESLKISEAVKNNDLYLVIGDEVIDDPKKILDLIMKNEDAFDGGSNDSNENDPMSKFNSKTGDNSSY